MSKSAPPLIGITAGASKEAPGYYLLRWDYTHSISEVGAIPVVLTPSKAARHPAYLDAFSAIVISGGGDVDPALYGEEPHATIRDVNSERDAFEMEIAHRALELGLPVLGICRGMQLLNVLLGGTLIQDLPSQIGVEISHDDCDRARDLLSHAVSFAPDSRLRQTFGCEELEVNSFHHQGIARLGEELVAVAWSEDGVIEAVEGKRESYLVGVQWHPESLWERGYPYLAIFEALREAALQRKQ